MEKTKRSTYWLILPALVLVIGLLAHAAAPTQSRYTTVTGWQMSLSQLDTNLHCDLLTQDGQQVLLQNVEDGQRILLQDMSVSDTREIPLALTSAGSIETATLTVDSQYLTAALSWDQGGVFVESVIETLTISATEEAKKTIITPTDATAKLTLEWSGGVLQVEVLMRLLPAEVQEDASSTGNTVSGEGVTENAESTAGNTENIEVNTINIDEGTPAADDDSTATDDDTPTSGDDTPTPGDDTPASGDDTPASGDDTPASGDDTPTPGDDTPASGDDTPASGDDTPASGDDTPASGDDTPAPGDDTTDTGDDTTDTGDDTTDTGDDTTTSGDDTPTPGDDTTAPGDGTTEDTTGPEEDTTEPEEDATEPIEPVVGTWLIGMEKFAAQGVLPLLMEAPEGCEEIRLELAVGENRAGQFPAGTRYSTDKGASYILLYDPAVICFAPVVDESGSAFLLVDFSAVELDKETTMTITASSLQGGTVVGVSSMQTQASLDVPKAELKSAVPMVTGSQNIQFAMPIYGDANYSFTVRRLPLSENQEEAMPLVILEDGTGKLTISSNDTQARAGTYKAELTWSWNEQPVARQEIVFYVNYTPYVQLEQEVAESTQAADVA